jgi:hypothetical protein
VSSWEYQERALTIAPSFDVEYIINSNTDSTEEIFRLFLNFSHVVHTHFDDASLIHIAGVSISHMCRRDGLYNLHVKCLVPVRIQGSLNGQCVHSGIVINFDRSVNIRPSCSVNRNSKYSCVNNSQNLSLLYKPSQAMTGQIGSVTILQSM